MNHDEALPLAESLSKEFGVSFEGFCVGGEFNDITGFIFSAPGRDCTLKFTDPKMLRKCVKAFAEGKLSG